MDASTVIDLSQRMLLVTLMLSAPVLIAGTFVGLLIGLFQALTQIQDQTVAFVPKLVAMVLVLSFCLPWAVQYLMDYSTELFENIPRVIVGQR